MIACASPAAVTAYCLRCSCRCFSLMLMNSPIARSKYTAGFDIMPTDVALSRVMRRLPGCHTVDVGIRGVNGAFSRGTARTSVAGATAKLGGAYVRNGQIVELAADDDLMRQLDYGKTEEGYRARGLEPSAVVAERRASYRA